tara:strand:+ start:147 stop:1130 length:984 start_codon:yes stop_codon:yes gene_type:complete
MRVMVRNLIIASMALTFFTMFGGNWMGAWFTIHSLEDVEGVTVSEGVTYFKLDERAFVVETTYDGETEKDTENIDYDDNDCGLAGDCDELDDLMMGKIRVLLYIQLLAGIAVFYFLNTKGVIPEKNYDGGEKACLVVGGAGLLALVLFLSSFPEALEDDSQFFEALDKDPSFLGYKEWEDEDAVYNTSLRYEFTISWRPSVAPFLVLFSGSAAIGAYLDIKNERLEIPKKRVKPKSAKIPLVIPEEFSIISEESDDWKLEKKDYLVFDGGSVDTFKPKDIQKVDSFKPKEMVPIKCPGCGSQMEIVKLNKMQDVKCDSCGLAGEIKK